MSDKSLGAILHRPKIPVCGEADVHASSRAAHLEVRREAHWWLCEEGEYMRERPYVVLMAAQEIFPAVYMRCDRANASTSAGKLTCTSRWITLIAGSVTEYEWRLLVKEQVTLWR